MKILYVNHYAGSPVHGMEFRPFYLAREWARHGHKVTIVAADFSHLRTRQPSSKAFPRAEDVMGVRYLWMPTTRYFGNGLGRILNILVFLAWLLVSAPFLAGSRLDVVVASSTYPLDIFPCWILSRIGGAQLVFEVHDLWPLTPIEVGGFSRNHPYIRLLQFAEDFACKHCDKVVSLLPLALPYLASRGLEPQKFVHIPNGVDLSEWEMHEALSETHSLALAKERQNGNFLVGYAGGHALSNALDVIIEAADRLQKEAITIVFVGQGVEKQRLMEDAKSRGLNRVLFLPPVPKAQVASLLASFDALVIAFHGSPLYRFGISPNKIFDYMMSARPIVMAHNAANDLVTQASCGESVPPDDPGALADALLRMSALDASERDKLGARGKEFVLSHHVMSALAKRFLA